MQKHILVIGGAGYIGSACVQALCEAGHAVTVYDNLRTGQRDKVDARATFVEGSVLDVEHLTQVCALQPFTACIHLAALKAVGESETNPAEYLTNNVTGTINVCTALASAHIPTLVFSSTAAVYAPHDGLVTEDAPLAPASVYGASKLLAEQAIREFVRTKKIERAVILRYFNVAGDTGLHFIERNAQNAFALLGQAALQGKTFAVLGTDYPTHDGTGVRDYIHLADLVDAHVRALDATTSLTVNLGTEKGVSVAELVSAFTTSHGAPLPITYASRRPGDIASVVASNSKAREMLGWAPTKTLTHMVESTLAAYK